VGLLTFVDEKAEKGLTTQLGREYPIYIVGLQKMINQSISY